MSSICLPKTTFSIQGQAEEFILSPQLVLAIGQKTSEGTATPGSLTKNIGSNGEEDQLFGKRSMLSEMIRAFKRVDSDTRIDAIALDDNPVGVKAEGFLELSGQSEEKSRFEFILQSKLHHSFSIDVSQNETDIDLINKVYTAIIEDETLNVIPERDLTSFVGTSGGLGVSTDSNQSYTNKTTADGLGSNSVFDVYPDGQTLYVGTSDGLSISLDFGNTFVNRTTADGLGSNTIGGIYAESVSVYAATSGGLSISKDSGASFINKTTADGLGANDCRACSISNDYLYVATTNGVAVSNDDGGSFVNKTTADGLGGNFVFDVVSNGNSAYVGTFGGLSISNDNGNTWTNKTFVDGLGSNFVFGVNYDEQRDVIYACTVGGLSISRDGGDTWQNKTVSDGLASNFCRGVYIYLNEVYLTYLAGFGTSVSNDNGSTWQLKTTADGLGSDVGIQSAVLQKPTLKLIATNAGEIGNSIGFSIPKSPDGIDVATFSGMGNFTAGSSDPDLTGVFDAVGSIRYQTIIWPANYDISIVKSFLSSRFNVSDDVLDGISISFDSVVKDDAKSYASSADSEVLVYSPVKKIDFFRDSSPSIFEFPVGMAAQFAGIRSSRLSLGRNVGYLIPGVQSGGALGGPQFAAVPYQNTIFYNLPVESLGIGWTEDEVAELKEAGCYLIGNNAEKKNIISGECITTKQKPKNSNFKFLNYVDTSSVIREFFFKNNFLEYAQSEITSGDLVPGKRMANSASISVFQTRLYARLSLGEINGVSYNLTQPGSDAIQFFKENLTVSINQKDGVVTIFCAVPIVSQLRQLDGVVQIVFDLSPSS